MTTKINDTYKLANDEIMPILIWYRDNDLLDPSRTLQSYAEEVFAHKWLYNHGIFKRHTKDTDLDGNESMIRLIGYKVIYILFLVFPRYFK